MLSIEDLLVDDHFVEWVLSDGQKHDAHWQAWMQQGEDYSKRVEEARALVHQLHRPAAVPSPQAAWQTLQSQLQLQPQVIQRRLNWWKVAAAISTLFALSWLLWPQQQQYQTAYGEIEQVELPDGTIVDLRANSTLWWEGDWAAEGVREVFLDGEAYFQVTSATDNEGMPFIVEAEPLSVRVLGTSFNVVNHDERTAVTLIEGRVEVQAADDSVDELKPNEHYTWQAVSQQSEIKTIAVAKLHTSWRQQVWHFEQTPLHEIAQQLEHDYGKTVIIDDAQLAGKKLSGSAPAKDLESLVKGISTSLGMQVEIRTNQIIFTP